MCRDTTRPPRSVRFATSDRCNVAAPRSTGTIGLALLESMVMAMPPPPEPAHRGPNPPPPNKAQQLVARSGFVLYEGGRSVFDESVLVYLAKHKTRWPDCDITDHVGRRLGAVRQKHRRRWVSNSQTSVFDAGGSQLLHVTPRPGLFSFLFDVSGVANGRYRSTSITARELVIEANNERFGSIRGPSFQGMGAGKIEILDQREEPVGAIRSMSAGSSFSSWDHYVMSIDPQVGGDFRRLLVAAPLIASLVKRTQRNQT